MSPASDLSIELIAKRSLAEDIVDRLREAILSGNFAPDEHLTEAALAKRLGVSRGPIRESLVQLEREGLIVRTRNKGAVVARLSRKDLDEVCTLRLALERLAVERAIEFATTEQFAALQTLVDSMRARGAAIQSREAADLDLHFHRTLFEASQHQRLLDAWLQLMPQILILLLGRPLHRTGNDEVVAIAHQRLLDVIRDRDQARAREVIDEHLRVSYEWVVAGYEHQSQ